MPHTTHRSADGSKAPVHGVRRASQRGCTAADGATFPLAVGTSSTSSLSSESDCSISLHDACAPKLWITARRNWIQVGPIPVVIEAIQTGFDPCILRQFCTKKLGYATRGVPYVSCSRIFQSRIFQSRIFSVPVVVRGGPDPWTPSQLRPWSTPISSMKYCHQRVCMSVCLCVHELISKTNCPNLTKFSVHVCLWPWLGPPIAALRNVTCFRFCKWRHVFA